MVLEKDLETLSFIPYNPSVPSSLFRKLLNNHYSQAAVVLGKPARLSQRPYFQGRETCCSQ